MPPLAGTLKIVQYYKEDMKPTPEVEGCQHAMMGFQDGTIHCAEAKI